MADDTGALRRPRALGARGWGVGFQGGFSRESWAWVTAGIRDDGAEPQSSLKKGQGQCGFWLLAGLPGRDMKIKVPGGTLSLSLPIKEYDIIDFSWEHPSRKRF